MRADFVEILRCPACHAERSFALDAAESDEREVRRGRLTCRRCGHEAPIEDGIVDLMHEPPDFVVREAAGLERFADRMRDDGWDRETVLTLPYYPSGYWFSQGASIEHLLEVVHLEAGARILDVGSNTCWASNLFAERGLEAVALDIAPVPMQGLRTADWWFEGKGTYFERMLSVMFDPALASESMDYVFCAQVLHHNDSRNLRRTLAELYRILKPGGKLLVINEPLRYLTDFRRDHAQEVDEYEGHEHVYFLPEYLLAARRAGFRVQIVRPNTSAFFRHEPFVLEEKAGVRETVFTAAKQLMRTSPRRKQAYTLYKLITGGPEISLSMIGEKPA